MAYADAPIVGANKERTREISVSLSGLLDQLQYTEHKNAEKWVINVKGHENLSTILHGI